jgi:phosphoribosyl-ATP pyrophosphohydrolase/phosphoribosyl-AMP cyclohydrolase
MTDRTIKNASDLDTIDFAKGDGLVPVVAQDAGSGSVLMVAYGNRDALEATIETGDMHFWSRSRSALWRKGETSGNTLTVRSLHSDCDADTILALVAPTGPACHTGEETCFGENGTMSAAALTLTDLAATLAQRDKERPDGSYTTRLLEDRNLRLKKLGEENAELVAALATDDTKGATEEAADLIYHLLAALQANGITLDDVAAELSSRAR